MIEAYLQQLTPIELKALDVARRTFGASFHIERTIGFITFQKKSDAKNLAR
jgi:hypothetical protein